VEAAGQAQGAAGEKLPDFDRDGRVGAGGHDLREGSVAQEHDHGAASLPRQMGADGGAEQIRDLDEEANEIGHGYFF
jgi:hypothetical protein